MTAIYLRRWMALVLGGLLLYAAPALAEEPPKPRRADRAQTSGPALAIGLGTQTVFVGGQLLYYVQLPSPRWRVAVHLGAGGIPTENEGGASWGMSGGTFFGFGRHHRLVVGVEAGTHGWETLVLHGEILDRHQMPGIGLWAGWEWMASFGMFTRLGIGPGLLISRATPLEDRDVTPTAVGGGVLGFKPW